MLSSAGLRAWADALGLESPDERTSRSGQTSSPHQGVPNPDAGFDAWPCRGRTIGNQVTYNAELGPTRYVAAGDRYEPMPYRRCGRSGLKLPALSLGLWQNFGDDRPLENSRAMLRRAFDLGITHFDLANNYGPPTARAEPNFGRILRRGSSALPRRARHLDEGRLRHVARPVRRVGLAQVPARQPRPEPASGWASTTSTSSTRTAFDPDTPLEETMGALDTAVRQGKALLCRHLLLRARR